MLFRLGPRLTNRKRGDPQKDTQVAIVLKGAWAASDGASLAFGEIPGICLGGVSLEKHWRELEKNWSATGMSMKLVLGGKKARARFPFKSKTRKVELEISGLEGRIGLSLEFCWKERASPRKFQLMSNDMLVKVQRYVHTCMHAQVPHPGFPNLF